MCEGPIGFEKKWIHRSSETNSARDQLGSNMGLKLPLISDKELFINGYLDFKHTTSFYLVSSDLMSEQVLMSSASNLIGIYPRPNRIKLSICLWSHDQDGHHAHSR